MGMIKCDVHGLSPITQYCIHIGAAVDAGTHEQAFVLIDGWNNPNALCSSCHARALDVVARSQTGPNDEPFDFGDETSEGGCTPHLTEW